MGTFGLGAGVGIGEVVALCRYLMVETTAAHLSLRQQKIMLANRPSPGQPITTNNKNPGSV